MGVTATTANMAPSVAVVGVHGHGASHLRRLAEQQLDGSVRIAAVVDPRPVDGHPDVPDGVRWYADLHQLLADRAPDVVVLATPIHTHLALASAAMRAGSDVLLEKPTVTSMAEHAELLDVVAQTARLCQVGFQTYASHALRVLERIVADGEIGTLEGVGAVGTWVRTAAYYGRARWAGRRTLDGVAVVDGVVTNPLAHAVATALLLADASRADQVADVVVDLHRAHPIEADDTSSVVVTTDTGLRVGAGLTVCAPGRSPARVVLYGSHGTATLFYETDDIEVDGRRGRRRIGSTRGDLLTNLLDVRAGRADALCADVASTGGFMRVLDAVRTAPDPAPIADEWLDRRGTGDERWPVVADIEAWCERVAREQRTFTQLGAPWA